MALILCPECMHKTSDSAELCPECGFNISKYIAQQKEIKRQSELKNKIIILKKQRDEYYNKKYKEIYNTIEIPNQPTNQGIIFEKYNFIFWFTIAVIFLIINICLWYLKKFNSLFVIANVIFIIISIYILIDKIPDAKFEYKCNITNYEHILKNPDKYKMDKTKQILSNDSKLIEYDQNIKKCFQNQELESHSNHKQIHSVNYFQPHCPTCGSPDIEKISIGKKMKGSFFFGFMSKDVRSTFHCKNCGYKW